MMIFDPPVAVGTDVYRSMLVDHGWSEKKWRTWVIETLSEALFGHAAGAVRARDSKRP